jgi:hypothetical protein
MADNPFGALDDGAYDPFSPTNPEHIFDEFAVQPTTTATVVPPTAIAEAPAQDINPTYQHQSPEFVASPIDAAPIPATEQQQPSRPHDNSPEFPLAPEVHLRPYAEQGDVNALAAGPSTVPQQAEHLSETQPQETPAHQVMEDANPFASPVAEDDPFSSTHPDVFGNGGIATEEAPSAFLNGTHGNGGTDAPQQQQPPQAATPSHPLDKLNLSAEVIDTAEASFHLDNSASGRGKDGTPPPPSQSTAVAGTATKTADISPASNNSSPPKAPLRRVTSVLPGVMDVNPFDTPGPTARTTVAAAPDAFDAFAAAGDEDDPFAAVAPAVPDPSSPFHGLAEPTIQHQPSPYYQMQQQHQHHQPVPPQSQWPPQPTHQHASAAAVTAFSPQQYAPPPQHHHYQAPPQFQQHTAAAHQQQPPYSAQGAPAAYGGGPNGTAVPHNNRPAPLDPAATGAPSATSSSAQPPSPLPIWKSPVEPPKPQMTAAVATSSRPPYPQPQGGIPASAPPFQRAPPTPSGQHVAGSSDGGGSWPAPPRVPSTQAPSPASTLPNAARPAPVDPRAHLPQQQQQQPQSWVPAQQPASHHQQQAPHQHQHQQHHHSQPQAPASPVWGAFDQQQQQQQQQRQQQHHHHHHQQHGNPLTPSYIAQQQQASHTRSSSDSSTRVNSSALHQPQYMATSPGAGSTVTSVHSRQASTAANTPLVDAGVHPSSAFASMGPGNVMQQQQQHQQQAAAWGNQGPTVGNLPFSPQLAQQHNQPPAYQHQHQHQYQHQHHVGTLQPPAVESAPQHFSHHPQQQGSAPTSRPQSAQPPHSAATTPAGWPTQQHQHQHQYHSHHHHHHHQGFAQTPSQFSPQSVQTAVSHHHQHHHHMHAQYQHQHQHQHQQQQLQQQQQPQQQWGGSFGAHPSRAPYRRHRCCPIAIGPSGMMVQLKGTTVVCDSVASALATRGTAEGQAFVASLQMLPGPLDASANKVDEVCDRLERYQPGRSALKALLLQLVKKPKFDWQQDWAMVSRALAEDVEHAAAYVDPAPAGSGLSARPPDPSVVAAIQNHVVAGRRKDAVRDALSAGQHAHALLIALMCDKETYVNTVQEIIRQSVAKGTPLWNAYHLFNDLPLEPQPTDIQPDDPRLRGWAQHVVMLASNYAQSSLEGIVMQGDALAQARRYEEAHFCYLLAQLSPDAQKPEIAEALRGKYTLLGGVHRREQYRSLLLSPRTFFFTEALEYSRRRLQEKYVRPQLVPFKAMIAVMLMEIGELAKARQYLDALAKLLPSPPKQPAAGGGGKEPAPADPITRTLPLFVDAYRAHMDLMLQRGGGGGGAGSSAAGGGLFGWLGGGGNKRAASQPVSAAAGPAGANKPGSTNASPIAAAGRAASTAPGTTATTTQPTGPLPPQQQQQPSNSGGANTASATGSSRNSPNPEGSLERTTSAKGRNWFGLLSRNKKQEEKDKVKSMILDSDDVPEFDPATGRYKFKQTDEEKHVEQRIRAGPPKMPMVPQQQQQAMSTASIASPGPAGGMLPPMPRHPGSAPPFMPPGGGAVGQSTPSPGPQLFVPAGAAAPFVPPPSAGMPMAPRQPVAPQYVDMFNS